MQELKSSEEIITTREDLFECFEMHDLGTSASFKIADFIRKGRTGKKPEEWKEYKSNLENHHVPDWYINACERIKYLFPRAHSFRYALDAYWCAWFKIHYPQEYYDAYFKTCVTPTLRKAVISGPDALQIYAGAIEDKAKENDFVSEDVFAKPMAIEVAKEMWTKGMKIENE